MRISRAKTNKAVANIAACAAALVWLACGPARSGVLDPRTVQSEVLANGLHLIVAPDPDARTVSVEVIAKVGAADEPPGQRGIAHVLEHVLWAGDGRNENDPRLRVERVGGVVNAGTLRDYTRFYGTAPAADLALLVEALGEIVLERRFDEAVVERERRAIAHEVAARAEDPRIVLSDLAFAQTYGSEHPYAVPVEGLPEHWEQIDSARLTLFHRTWYVPNNMAVVVAGKVSFDATREVVARTFGGMAPAPTPPPRRERAARPAPPGERVVSMPIERAYLMAAFVGPEAAERSQVCASDLLAMLLAHDPTGRLVEDLRDHRGLVSALGVEFLTQRDRALFGIWVVCQADQVEETKEAVQAALRDLAQRPPRPAELARAKRLLAAGYAFANETPADRALTLAFYEAVDSFRTACHYLGWVAHARPADIAEVAAWYSVDPVWVVLAPEGAPR